MASKQKMDIDKKKVVTPEFRVSYPSVFEPKAFADQEPKYSLVCLFDKKTDLKAMKVAAMNAALDLWGSKEKFPKKMRWPFRDGNERQDTAGYTDTIFITASSKHQPGLVDHNVQAIIAPRDFYAGCYARAELIAFAYEKMGNAGVSFSLQNIQKLREGEKFGGRKNAEDVFSKVDDGSEDMDNYEESGDDNELGF